MESYRKSGSVLEAALEDEGVRAEAAGSSTFETLRERSQRVNVDGTEFFLVEGDLLLNEDELQTYAFQRDKLQQTREAARQAGLLPVIETGLLGVLVGDKLIRWRPGLELTYCVLRNTFLNEERYQMVRENMAKATEDWQNVCGILFRHVADLDQSPGTNNPGVLFTVREFDSGGLFIAAAFFPGDPSDRRRMLIDRNQYFDNSPGGFDKVGVLRHELGHVLGFRHEHIRSEAPPTCPNEDPGFDLTQYDPKSVMHYLCGAAGTPQLALTELDRTGSQRLYGPSFKQVIFADAD
jgi:hypothetical protein